MTGTESLKYIILRLNETNITFSAYTRDAIKHSRNHVISEITSENTMGKGHFNAVFVIELLHKAEI